MRCSDHYSLGRDLVWHADLTRQLLRNFSFNFVQVLGVLRLRIALRVAFRRLTMLKDRVRHGRRLDVRLRLVYSDFIVLLGCAIRSSLGHLLHLSIGLRLRRVGLLFRLRLRFGVGCDCLAAGNARLLSCFRHLLCKFKF